MLPTDVSQPMHPDDRLTATGHTVEYRRTRGRGAAGWAALGLEDIYSHRRRFAMDSKAERS